LLVSNAKWFWLLGPVSDREQLVEDASNSRDGPQHEVSPLQVEPSAAEKYVNI